MYCTTNASLDRPFETFRRSSLVVMLTLLSRYLIERCGLERVSIYSYFFSLHSSSIFVRKIFLSIIWVRFGIFLRKILTLGDSCSKSLTLTPCYFGAWRIGDKRGELADIYIRSTLLSIDTGSNAIASRKCGSRVAIITSFPN